MNERIECSGCGSIDLDPVKKERLCDKKHYTDYKITYKCKKCGVLTEVPGSVKS
jgi:uncharacterized Zn finger protein